MAFDRFRQFGTQVAQMKKMRDEAMRLQKQMAAETVVIEEKGIRVVASGDQKIRELMINGEPRNDLTEVLNKALKKAQEVAAKKLQQSGGLGSLGSLLGK